LYLALANIENNRGNDLEAETYIKKALAIKTNYTQARFLWAQIQLAGGKTDAAIKTLQDAVVQSPFDIGAPFQLGILYFGEEYYSKAIESFELVVRLVPDHANARYYMGLAYEKIGKKAEALAQFKKIQETNPDNTELQSIIDRLSKGKSSNADTSALDTLPLDESTE